MRATPPDNTTKREPDSLAAISKSIARQALNREIAELIFGSNFEADFAGRPQSNGLGTIGDFDQQHSDHRMAIKAKLDAEINELADLEASLR